MLDQVKLSDFQITLQRKISPKGIKFVHFNKPNAPIAIKICSRSGARFDPAEKAGLAHFVEHLLFDGSDKFPNKKELALSFDDLGASFSGSTGPEYTCIDFIIARQEHLPFVSEVVDQIFNHSKFSEKAIELERNIIKTEISSKMDRYQKLLSLGMLNLMYGDHPLARNVAGTEDSVNAITREDILTHFNTHFFQDITVVTCGGCDITDIYNLFDPVLKSRPYESKLETPMLSLGPRYGTTKMVDQNLIHCSFTLPTPGVGTPDSAPLNVIATYLGKGRASLLKDILRYNEGLLYSISAGNERYSDTGFFYINFNIKKENLLLVLSKIHQVLQRFKLEGIDPNDLRTIKNKIVNSGIIPTQTVQFWVSSNFYRELLIRDKNDTYADFLNEISNIEKNQIDEVIQKYFSLDKMYFYAVGNIEENEVRDALNSASQCA